VAKYTKYNGRRKPELLEATTYSLENYREADSVAADFKVIAEKAEAIYKQLPQGQKDAFYELVLYPTKASAVVTQLNVTVGKNRLYASQGRASTNGLAEQARALFRSDAELSRAYNHALAQGKWNHMMDQTHIGYTSWNEPPANTMPKVVVLDLPRAASMGVAVEGSALAWPGANVPAKLPQFDIFRQQRFYVDIFNRGQSPFDFIVNANAPWIVASEAKGRVRRERRIWISVDWGRAPEGSASGSLTITSDSGQTVSAEVNAFRPAARDETPWDGFVESNGYVSIEAAHYASKSPGRSAQWEEIEDLGRTLSAMTIFPVTAESLISTELSPRLEYKMYLFDAGSARVDAIVDPTRNFVPGRGLRYAVSFDDETPQIVDLLANDNQQAWETSVKDSARIGRSTHTIASPGHHTLKIWMVDPGVVLQKFVVDLGGVKPSYLGPPESYFRRAGPSSP